MYRKTTPQSSLFAVENCFPGVIPDDDWCFGFQKKVLPLIDEEKFKHFYSNSPDGRPNASIKTMVSLLIFMSIEKLNWREVEFQFPRRLDWLIATRTALGLAKIDHTTLFKFYQMLEKDDTAREFFVKITKIFAEACGTSFKKQRTDSFFIHGWLQTLSRYGLFRETLRSFLLALRKQKPGLYEGIKGELSRDYLEKEFDLTEKDREEAQRKVSLMAKDLYQIKCAFENHKQVQHYDTFKILSKVFGQQCEVKETPEAKPEIIIKEKPDADTICTPHNPEARYVRKKKQRVTGDKGFITETCDKENKVQFITDVEVEAATESDAKQQTKIQERLIKNKIEPEKQYGDAGFVNGGTIIESKQKGIELEGPTAGRSQSLEGYEDKERVLDAGDFEVTVDEQSGELTIDRCPMGQLPKDQKLSEVTDKTVVHFDRDVCTSCSRAKDCPVKIGKRVATVTIDDAQHAGAVRHHKYMSSPEYRKDCAIRAGVEATVSELTRAHGVRKSRHKERSRTKLQLIFAAIACNVKRFIAYGKQYAYLETAFA